MKYLAKSDVEKAQFMREFNVWKYVHHYNNIFAYTIWIFRLAAHQSCVSLYGIVDDGTEFGFVAEYCLNGSLYLTISVHVVYNS